MENAGEEYDTESVEQPQVVPEPDMEPDVYERPGPRVVRDPDPAWDPDPGLEVAPGQGPRALRDTDADWGLDADEEDLDPYPGGTGSEPVPLWAREGPSADRIRATLGWDAEAGAEDDVADEASPGGRREPAFEGARSRRRRPLTLVLVALSIVLLSAASAYAYSARMQPKIYGAETQFLLTARAELSDAAVDRATQTQTLIVTSASVLQPVADQSRMPLSTLRDAVSAEMEGRSNIMRVTVADSDPKRALTLAKLVATRYAEVSVPRAEGTDPPGVRISVLTPTRGLDQPLEPRPQRAAAAGALLGLLLAAVVVVALWRPWRAARPAPYWDEARSG